MTGVDSQLPSLQREQMAAGWSAFLVGAADLRANTAEDSGPCQTGAVDGDPAQRPHASLRSSDILEGTLEDATRHTDVESTTPTSLEQDASRNNLSQTTRFASDEATPITSETNASSASSSAGVRVPPVDCFGAHLSNTGKSALRERLRLSRTEALKSSSNTSVTQENTGTLSVGNSAANTQGADAISHSAALSSDDVGSAPAHVDLEYGCQVEYLGCKPRALNNMMGQRFGAGSCWLNAALQCLWSIRAFQQVFAATWEKLSTNRRKKLCSGACEYRRQLGPATGPGLLTTDKRSTPLGLEEEFLAATFKSVYIQKLPWETYANSQALSPYLMADHYYHGRQEDVGEFLSGHILDADACPHLAQLTKCTMEIRLHCGKQSCRHVHESRQEIFTHLNIPIVEEGASQQTIDCLQDAVTRYLLGTVVCRREACAGCGETDLMYDQVSSVRILPAVLMLVLNRWVYSDDGSGRRTERCVNHPVTLADTLKLSGSSYALRSVVIHIGATSRAGHYTTLARHDVAGQKGAPHWWLYDDAVRTSATDNERRAWGRDRHNRDMKSYIVFYEKQ